MIIGDAVIIDRMPCDGDVAVRDETIAAIGRGASRVGSGADLCGQERGGFTRDAARIVDRPKRHGSPRQARAMHARVAATMQRGQVIQDGTRGLAQPGGDRCIHCEVH
jgi:hypothetical protein